MLTVYINWYVKVFLINFKQQFYFKYQKGKNTKPSFYIDDWPLTGINLKLLRTEYADKFFCGFTAVAFTTKWAP